MNTWLCSTSDTPALSAEPGPPGINTAAASRPSPDGDLPPQPRTTPVAGF
jgi:hypothetical protein